MLSVGAKAPWFSVPDQDGEIVSLDDYKGRKLIIYLYPKDDTAGCTTPYCYLRDNIHILRKQGFEVLGVCPDPVKSHLKFIEKFDLPFRLLSDPDRQTIDAYGVWGWKNF